MTQTEQKHPADELAKAIARASGILTLLSECYDRGEARFETGTSFVAESICAVENILQNAGQALGRLYQTCDLTIVREMPMVAPSQQTVAPPMPEPELKFQSRQHSAGLPQGDSYLGFFGPTEVPQNVVSLAGRLDTILVNMPPKQDTPEVAPLEKPAESYEELLQKISALADLAAYQAPSDGSLAPALESLKADFLKFRTVA